MRRLVALVIVLSAAGCEQAPPKVPVTPWLKLVSGAQLECPRGISWIGAGATYQLMNRAPGALPEEPPPPVYICRDADGRPTAYPADQVRDSSVFR